MCQDDFMPPVPYAAKTSPASLAEWIPVSLDRIGSSGSCPLMARRSDYSRPSNSLCQFIIAANAILTRRRATTKADCLEYRRTTKHVETIEI